MNHRSTTRTIAGLFGAVYLVVGALGFTVSGGHHAFGQDGGKLVGLFEVNAAHNVAHLAIGLALVLAARASIKASRVALIIIGSAYLALAVLGTFLVGGDNHFNILALNAADNVLHLGSAALLLAVGIWADRRAGVAAEATPTPVNA